METDYIKYLLKSSKMHLMLDIRSLALDVFLWRSAPFGHHYFAHIDIVSLDNTLKQNFIWCYCSFVFLLNTISLHFCLAALLISVCCTASLLVYLGIRG